MTVSAEQVYLPNPDVLANPITGAGPEKAFLAKKAASGAAAPRAPAGTQRAPQKRGGFFGRK